MSKIEWEKLGALLESQTVEQLRLFYIAFAESTEEELNQMLARHLAALYVRRQIDSDLRAEIPELHRWIHGAFDSNSERLKALVHEGASVGTESGRIEKFVG